MMSVANKTVFIVSIAELQGSVQVPVEESGNIIQCACHLHCSIYYFSLCTYIMCCNKPYIDIILSHALSNIHPMY